ncbi:phage NrS-1 polymerase family protein [Halobaculum limi]|uniref:phage NrS-1 polymerase family protein n=1 Tax=Halobaculum limi TaxID=3031916 RepID=UPI002406995A|nr:hypothetical protein [Halobaculum sp. YSMS11]
MTDGNLPTAADLPDAMVERSQWLCWRGEERDGKLTKVPIDPSTGGYASTTDSATWASFNAARAAAADEDGLGFVFTAPDTLVGVDLDACRDPNSGALDTDARAIVECLDSFTEVSPSGTGVHVIAAGSLPDGRNRHGTVEMYDEGRFFTVTGDHLSETPLTVERRPSELQAVHAEYVAAATPADDRGGAPTDRSASAATQPGLSDDELLDRARTAANGEKFTRLFDGSTAGYPSQSEADMALCSLLAFWTGGDEAQMDRLFRESGLFRGKWDDVHFADGATYGGRTIERAVAGTSEFYEPPATDSWTAFDTNESGTRHNETETTVGDDTPPEPTPISTDVLVSVRAELEALEAENERLREALSAERAQRHELEVALEEEKEQKLGILGRLFSRR